MFGGKDEILFDREEEQLLMSVLHKYQKLFRVILSKTS